MKTIKLNLCCLLLIASQSLWANQIGATENESTDPIQSAAELKAALYSIQKEEAAFEMRALKSTEPTQGLQNTLGLDVLDRGDCLPTNRTSCIEFVAGSYPTTNERLEAAKTCAGVYSGDCVKFVAGSYPTTSQRKDAALACRGVFAVECVEFVAGSYPTTTQKKEAAAACVNVVDGACVKYVAGSYPTRSQKIAAARACAGN